MKKAIQISLCVFCTVIIISLLLVISVYYTVNCKKTFRDTSISPDGKYELTLLEIGEPAWPFGAASGQLILNEGNTIISQKNFELRNDGCNISSNDWAVTWNENHVEVILSGNEQSDEQICLYYDGAITQQLLTDSTEPPQTYPTIKLDIAVIENRENELVFDISIKDYIDSFIASISRTQIDIFLEMLISGSVLPMIRLFILPMKRIVIILWKMKIFTTSPQFPFMSRPMPIIFRK